MSYTPTPIEECPPWLVIFIASFGDDERGLDALYEVKKRGLRLAADPDRHGRIYHETRLRCLQRIGDRPEAA